ncbi:MAG: Gfo/Idh/MocA family oxidoreductase [Clostridiaceae bacterium]|nr:Gfo/Idh/MocA family oxidoreductase [Clostridiaceae bacterium]
MIRAGILGLGYMGNCHLQKIQATDGITATSTHDIDPAKKTAAAAAGLTFFADRQAFLAQPDMDLVIITTPNQYHKDLAIAALRAGKNVLCEKPVTLNVAELDEIIAVARQTGKLFTVHQNRRWDTDFLTLKKIIDDGLLGTPISVESRVLGERGIVFGWRADPAYGGGMLYDWGVHQVDQLLQLFAGHQVTRIYAQTWSVNTPAVDDYFKLEIIFDNQTTAHVECGVFALEKLPRWFVYGDSGTLKIDDFSAKTGRVSKINKNATVEVSEGIDPLVGTSRTMAPLQPEQIEHHVLPVIPDASHDFYQNLVLACQGLAQPLVTPESVRRTMQVIDAAFLSAKTRQSVAVQI